MDSEEEVRLCMSLKRLDYRISTWGESFILFSLLLSTFEISSREKN